ncbi:MAG TPA: sialidase family protein, partial [Planctomycetota bacterium]|nr:sialidase family protein [Planctomycetota bacterium]
MNDRLELAPDRFARRILASCAVVLVFAGISLPSTMASEEAAPTSSATDSPAHGRPGVLSVRDLFVAAPFDECHASTLVETERGILVAFFAGTSEGHADVGIWLSRIEGGEPSPPVEIANGIQHEDLRYPCWNPVLYAVDSKRLLLFYKVGPSPSAWWGMLTESRDAGATWSEPRRLPETILGPVRNKPILLEDGSLLCPSSTEDNGWQVHFEITRDLGRTWKRVGPVNDGKEFGAIQPTLLELGGSKLAALCRSRQGRIVRVDSEDGGLTWSPMRATALPNPNSGIDAVTLDDRRHLLVYNHSVRRGPFPSGREILNVAVSDDAETWKSAVV